MNRSWTAQEASSEHIKDYLFFNCGERCKDLRGILTHDLCDTGVVLYKLSYQANWEPVTFKPVSVS